MPTVETENPKPATAYSRPGTTQEVDIREVLLSLQRRWMIMAIVAAVVFGLVAFITFKQKKIYESSAKVVVSGKKSAPSDPSNIIEDISSLQGGSVKTQVEIINSPQLLRGAFNRLTKKEQDSGFRGHMSSSSYSVRALEDTDVILVTVRSLNKGASKSLANAIVQEYLDRDLARNTQAVRQGREYVERQRDATATELMKATSELAQFKRDTGLVAPGPQVSLLATSYAELSAGLNTATKEAEAAKQQLADVTSKLKGLAPEVDFQHIFSENPEYTAVRAEVVSLENRMAGLKQIYTASSPEITQTQRDLNDSKDRLKKLSATMVSQSSVQRNPAVPQLQALYATFSAGAITADAKRAGIEHQLQIAKEAMVAYPEKERQYATLEQKALLLKGTFEILTTTYFKLLIEEERTIPTGMFVSEAEASSAPSSPNVPSNLAIGALLAVFFGLLSGVVANYLDNKMHQLDDIERISGASILSLVPEISTSNDDKDNLYIGKAAPVHAFLESFRMLRNNVGFKLPGQGAKVIAVSSSLLGEGKSTVACNLAIAMSMDQKNVLIVEADLRRPTVHNKFQLSKDVGLTNLILESATLGQVIQKTAWENLTAITSGPLPPDPVEFLNTRESHAVIESLKEHFDVIILDAPPCIGLSDMQVICKLCDGIVLVTALDQTTRQQLGATIRMISQAGGRLLGHVVNRVKAQRTGYYGYYSYNSYDETTGKKKRKKRTSNKG